MNIIGKEIEVVENKMEFWELKNIYFEINIVKVRFISLLEKENKRLVIMKIE